ncbi:DUF4367 domain-containing protein [Ammoniphilus sp. YIM 78166]|uniref:DUF4367 domain-containing protein n=1 Tax=Ammoniphilus sp. YIM 78166 TaxID=1644106 RepID=UPI0010703ADB|nr:DUF4367 domain-containing protein [Ammoniphilus sp. YIM 78166]
MMKKDGLDELIKDLILDQIKNSPAPPLSSTEAWEKIQPQIGNASPSRYSFSKWKGVYAVSGFILLLVLLITWSPNNGGAFQKIIQMMQGFKENSAQMMIRVGDTPDNGKGAPPQEEFSIIPGSQSVPQNMTLEEAQEIMKFPIMVPQVVPGNFNLNHATVMTNAIDEKYSEIILYYSNDIDKEKFFYVQQFTISDQFGAGATYGDRLIEEVNIGGHKATLAYSPKEEFSTLTWVTQSHYISIWGHLTKDEIIQVAKSLR